MDIIETAIEIVKQNYNPPFAFCNQERVKNDLICFFADIVDEVVTILQQDLPSDLTAARIRSVINHSGLSRITRKENAKKPPALY